VRKLDQSALGRFLGLLSRERRVYTISRPDPEYHLDAADAWNPDQHTLALYRPVEPLKALIFPPVESVGSLGAGDPAPDQAERIVFGVKNCDLSALSIHDYVFLHTEPVDPFYAAARERTLIVSCDCTDARDVCFCTAVKEQPYPRAGFDVNLSLTSQGYLVEAGSDKGEALLQEADEVLSDADDAIVSERDRNRAALTARITDQAAAYGLTPDADLQAATRGAAGADLWDDIAADCVECGACNLACSTCHCFLLADGLAADGTATRVKKWDACVYRNFARVAGGANPRKHRADRLYNRFEKKFSFFPELLGRYACTGCGRCIEACPGGIDIRDILKRVMDEH
jgi:ferredoxin